MYKKRTEKDIWDRINVGDISECWEYKGGKNKAGYGLIYFNGKLYLTHRLSYEFSHGFILDELKICHFCDNPPCCNPFHLFAGTDQDNVTDKMIKGRYKPNIKFDDNVILEIFNLKGKLTAREIAKRFNTSHSHVINIWNGKSRKNLVLNKLSPETVKNPCKGYRKFDEDLIIEVRSWQGKISQRVAAKKFNISQSQVWNIWNDKQWKNLTLNKNALALN